MNIEKEGIAGFVIEFAITILILILVILGDFWFLIITSIFFILGASYEFVVMNHFISLTKKQISKKDKLEKRAKFGLLWVHNLIRIREHYNCTIYDYKKIGFLPSSISYLAMFLYTFFVFILTECIGYYSFLFYLIPIVTNGTSFFRHNYLIVLKKRREE